eukprot:4492040-Amphidinium_carterae.1
MAVWTWHKLAEALLSVPNKAASAVSGERLLVETRLCAIKLVLSAEVAASTEENQTAVSLESPDPMTARQEWSHAREN